MHRFLQKWHHGMWLAGLPSHTLGMRFYYITSLKPLEVFKFVLKSAKDPAGRAAQA
jgi:hypothetical protein